MLLAPEVTPVTQPLLADSDISHEVCCVDEEIETGRISMCGVPIEDGPLDDEGELTCAVCVDLFEQWARNADLYGEDPHNPGDPPCRLCPKRRQELR